MDEKSFLKIILASEVFWINRPTYLSPEIKQFKGPVRHWPPGMVVCRCKLHFVYFPENHKTKDVLLCTL